MSLIVKLGVVGVTAGASVLAAAQMQGVSVLQLPGVADAASLVGLSSAAAAPGVGGPFDRIFTVRRGHIDKMVAIIDIVPGAPGQPVRIQANGKPDTMKELQVHAVGDEVLLR